MNTRRPRTKSASPAKPAAKSKKANGARASTYE